MIVHLHIPGELMGNKLFDWRVSMNATVNNINFCNTTLQLVLYNKVNTNISKST